MFACFFLDSAMHLYKDSSAKEKNRGEEKGGKRAKWTLPLSLYPCILPSEWALLFGENRRDAVHPGGTVSGAQWNAALNRLQNLYLETALLVSVQSWTRASVCFWIPYFSLPPPPHPPTLFFFTLLPNSVLTDQNRSLCHSWVMVNLIPHALSPMYFPGTLFFAHVNWQQIHGG